MINKTHKFQKISFFMVQCDEEKLFGNRLGKTSRFRLNDRKVITARPPIKYFFSLMGKALISKG